MPAVKDLAAIEEKLPEVKLPLLGSVAESKGDCGSDTDTGTDLSDGFLPWSPLPGQSTVDELAPQPLNPSLVLAEPPMTQRARTSLSLHHQGGRGDPPQPFPVAAPDAEGSSPLPALHNSVNDRARGSRTGDPSADTLRVQTGLVAPGTGDTGDPGGTLPFLGPEGLPRPTLYTRVEIKGPPSSKDTSGMDIPDWLQSILAGEEFMDLLRVISQLFYFI